MSVLNGLKSKLISKEDDNLEKKVIKGSFWVTVVKVVQKLLGLARNIVLARILAPSDFGLFGIALLTLSLLERFTTTGFSQAIIAKKEKPHRYLDTAWTVEAIRGVFLAGILLAGAGWVGSFFNEPQATNIIRLLSFNILISGFTNIGTVFFRKNLKFEKEFIYKVGGPIVDLIVTIVAVLIMRNIYALVIGSLAGAVVNLTISYLIHPYRPKFRIDIKRFKELFDFSKWIFGSSVVDYLLTEGDDILVGRVLGATTLGIYQMAYRISNFPATQVTHLIGSVSYPAYSKLQDRPQKLREAYLKFFKVITFFSFPLAFFIYFFAYDFTFLVLSEKWLPAVVAIQGLALWGLVRSIGASTGPIFKAKNRPDIPTKIGIFKLIVLAASIYPLMVNYGLNGVIIAVVGSAVVTNPIADYILIKFINLRIWQFLERLIFPCLGVVFTWLGLLALKGSFFCLSIMTVFSRTGFYPINIKNFLKKQIG
jgi:O-antigen/teichoic acid export membrane protein